MAPINPSIEAGLVRDMADTLTGIAHAAGAEFDKVIGPRVGGWDQVLCYALLRAAGRFIKATPDPKRRAAALDHMQRYLAQESQ